MTAFRSALFSVLAITATASCAALDAHGHDHDHDAGDAARVISTIADGDHRSDKNRARNGERRPAKTLAFFGIQPDMTVVEIAPGGGWYSEILAPYLKDHGVYYAGHYDPEHEREYYRNSVARYKTKLDGTPKLYEDVRLTIFSPPSNLQAAPKSSADMVVTFRNTHGWMRDKGQDAAFAHMFDILKPGGILGIVQHRGDATKPQDPDAKSGYVRQDVMIKMIEAAGFKLVASSEINANPKDRKDYPDGVWTLPPSFNGDDAKRDEYAAIGESDRMTLKFMKPE